ncbi:hypothetical protein [Skermania piniformis]|uniref:hypothetical protein n=1 Tax=Skermania pinensis TaxID=39122 RepID=UPI001FE68656|nr:hypothetical protein [Skermania piniformis]
MELSDEQRLGLNAALSEARCRGVSVDEPGGIVRIQLDVLTLPESGPPPPDAAVSLVLSGVARIAASFRLIRWDAHEPLVHPLTPAGLDEAVRSFEGGALHGWEFIDLPESSWAIWREMLSFDVTLGDRTGQHVLEMSQEEGMIDPRVLDLRVWFDTISVEGITGQPLSLTDFIAGGVRWWAAHDSGDPRTLVDDVAPPL